MSEKLLSQALRTALHKKARRSAHFAHSNLSNMNKFRVRFEYFKVYVIDFELETWRGENLKCWGTSLAKHEVSP